MVALIDNPVVVERVRTKTLIEQYATKVLAEVFVVEYVIAHTLVDEAWQGEALDAQRARRCRLAHEHRGVLLHRCQ